MPKKKKVPRISRWKKLVTAGLAAVTLAGGVFATKTLPYFVGEQVIGVIDGDTLVIANKQPIRLHGINAPELEYCMGKDAKSALTSLVEGKRVVVREPVSDGRGRILALMYIDGVLINEVMIRAGLASYVGNSGPERDRMRTAGEYARENKLGIYSPVCYQLEPPEPSCTIKGNFDNNEKERIYFTQACRFYPNVDIHTHEGDSWFCTEKEAQEAGFVRSENCE